MSSPGGADTRALTATCHCKSSTLSFTVPTSSLPLSTHFCHCTTCRKTHGTLSTIHTPIPAPTFDISTFTAYKSSERVVRYFCSTCGAHMIDKASQDGNEGAWKWCVATSLVDAEEGVWKFGQHIFVEDTVDGGLVNWLNEIDGNRLKMWKRRSADADEEAKKNGGDWVAPTSTGEGEGWGRKERKLRARCHCGGIDLLISRPKAEDFEGMPKTLTPKDKSKWFAITDACTSCRLLSSSIVTAWVFPAVSAITLADGSPYTPISGTAKYYSSSKGVSRTFCGTCGALVSYACDDRPEMIDIGVGLLESDAGVLAGDWLEWRTHDVGYGTDAVWKVALKALKYGLARWDDSSSKGRL